TRRIDRDAGYHGATAAAGADLRPDAAARCRRLGRGAVAAAGAHGAAARGDRGPGPARDLGRRYPRQGGHASKIRSATRATEGAGADKRARANGTRAAGSRTAADGAAPAGGGAAAVRAAAVRAAAVRAAAVRAAAVRAAAVRAAVAGSRADARSARGAG